MVMLILIKSLFIAIASAADVTPSNCDAKVGDNAVVGTSLMQASTKATISVHGDLVEDPFSELEDSFEISQKDSIDSFSQGSAIDAAFFWISCSQDFFVFAFVLFVVPFVAGKFIQTHPLKKVGKSLKQVEQVAPIQKCTAVNLGQLMRAARSGDEALWRSALHDIPNFAHAADSFGCTALHVAAHADCVELAKVVLEAGADVDAKDTWEETPLHFASRNGSLEMCELLLAKGAELDALNSDDVTPLVASAKARNESVCQMLLDRGGTCRGLSDADVPPLLQSLLMFKMILPPSKEPKEHEADT